MAATHEKASGFEPSVWGDYFINYELQPLQRSEEWMRERADKLKKDVAMLFQACDDVVGKMNLVDAIQHLGINHLFEEQIDTALCDIHGSEFNSSNLHEVALRFRLLREHGLWVPPDVFKKFKGEDGTFSKDVANEPRGLLSLYNAAYLFIHGEPELEEAISFARHHLESATGGLKSPLAEQVKRALHLPLPRTYKRVETLHYILEYKQDERHNPILLELAKLDFNLLQHVHLMELKAISEWWKDLYRHVGLTYSRDRMVEAYFWSYMVFYEHGSARARIILAKIVMITTLLDDTYDVHATIEECRKLDAAIQRWDESAISLLPEYLKKFYNKVLSGFKEFEDELADNEKYRIDYIKKAFKTLSTYYFQEAEWCHNNHKPSFKEQVNVSSISSVVPMLCVAMMVGMGDEATKEVFDWALDIPDAALASGKIGRIMNDIASLKKGKNKGDVASSLECYINEHKVTGEVAIAKMAPLLEDAWKTLNQARFEHRALLQAVQRVINLTVSMPLMYDESRDAYTFSTHLQKTIESLFVKPIPI